MEKKPKDQNLADAADDTTRAFNPPNALSATEKEPVGPFGEARESEASKAIDSNDEMRQTHIIPTDQTDHPSPNKDNPIRKSDIDRPLNQ